MWTFEEEELCKKLLSEGKSYEEVAKISGKNINTISSKNNNGWKIFEYRKYKNYKISHLPDLTGKFIGKLFVIKQVKSNKKGHRQWLCKCECGNEIILESYKLISNIKGHCGCLTAKRKSDAKKKYNKYQNYDDYMIGYTQKDEKFYFDKDDFDLIKNYCWFIREGYIVARNRKNNNKTEIRLHRLIMNAKNGEVVDHINHNTLDNRKSNLRICNNIENSWNHKIKSHNTSGATGINKRKEDNKWRARIWINGKCVHLGYFENFEDAVKARKESEEKYYGEYKYQGDINEL